MDADKLRKAIDDLALDIEVNFHQCIKNEINVLTKNCVRVQKVNALAESLAREFRLLENNGKEELFLAEFSCTIEPKQRVITRLVKATSQKEAMAKAFKYLTEIQNSLGTAYYNAVSITHTIV